MHRPLGRLARFRAPRVVVIGSHRVSDLGFWIFAALAALALLALVSVKPARAITLPAQFVAENAVPGVTFDTPTAIAFLPDGRMLVAEKRGRLWAVSNGVRAATPMWSRENEVLNQHDRGFLGLAVDPNYAQNRYLYMMYTVDPDSNGVDTNDDAFGRIVRYQVSAGDPNAVDMASRTVLIGATWRGGIPIGSPSHTIGDLHFGADGSLLVSAGDGAQFTSTPDAGGVDPNLFGATRTDPYEDIGAFRAQYIGSLAGKILRINPANGHGYPSNPFYDGNTASNASRVWCYGLRNPFRFHVRPGTGSTDPAAGNPGVLYIGDVGWITWEDQHIAATGGKNFGWPCYEGVGQNPPYQNATPAHHGCSTIGQPGVNPAFHTPPPIAYHHTTASLSSPPGFAGNTAIGGVFYRGTRYPAQYRNQYFFADYGQSFMRVAQVDANDQLIQVLGFATGADGPVDLAVDPGNGDLMYVAINTGEVRRIRWTGAVDNNQPPIASASGIPVSGPAPLAVQFSSAGSSDPDGDPLTYSWNFGDGQLSSAANPQHTYAAAGAYQSILSVSDGRGGLTRDTVAVTATSANTPPQATIVAPVDRSPFIAGQQISLQGTGSDAQDSGAALDFHWQVDLVHNTHSHPESFTADGPTASFVAEDHDDGTGVHYEITLRVTDTGGLSSTANVEIHPEVDLRPSAVTTVPASPTTADAVTYSFTVENLGRMLGPISRWRLRAGGLLLAEGDVVVPAQGGTPVSVTVGPNLAAGTHTLRVTVDSLGTVVETNEANNSATRALVVAAAPNRPPVANAAGAPNSGLAPLSVSFSSSGTSDPDGDPLSYAWAFGDGGTSTLANPIHSYAEGEYAAVLTVSDGRGGVARDTVPILATGRPVFPTTGLLDTFNRADGPLGGSWAGVTGLAIASNTMAVVNREGFAAWNGASFGPDQEAHVTLTAITPKSPEHNLLLKLQGTTAGDAHIEVRFDLFKKRVSVWTYTPGVGFQQRGATVSATFAAGQRIGARAFRDGTVDVHRNGALIASFSVAGWAHAASGGRIGVQFVRATSTRLDDFGGGTMAQTAPLMADEPALEDEGTGLAAAEEVETTEETQTPAPFPPSASSVREIQLSPPYPNPSNGNIAMNLDLPQAAEIEYGIHDLQGRLVWRESQRAVGPGRHSLSWNGVTLRGDRAPVGMYLARVVVDGKLFARRFVITR